MNAILTAILTVAGYITLHIFSNPTSRLHRKLPNISLKNLQILPSIKITVKGRVIHFHHWFSFTILLCISIFVTSRVLDSWLTRGFLFGGIVQGLRFPDRGIFKKDV